MSQCKVIKIGCSDHRVQSVMRGHLEKFHDVSEDRNEVFPILNAGSQKLFATKSTRNSVLEQIAIAVSNGAHTCVLFAHEDCGAYGGSERFQNQADEKQTYVNDLHEAERQITRQFAGKLKIEKILLLRKSGTDDFNRFEKV